MITSSHPILRNKNNPHPPHQNSQQQPPQPVNPYREFSITIPIAFKKRRSHKTVLSYIDNETLTYSDQPNQTTALKTPRSPSNPAIDKTLLQALVKADLWQRQLKKRQYKSLRELAREQQMSHACVLSIFQLNFLAPRFKTAILKGTQPRHLKLADLKKGVPLLWAEQEALFFAGGDNETN